MPKRREKTPGSDKVRERVVHIIRLIIARKINGVEYAMDLAERIRSDRSRVSMWTSGKGHPTVDNLEALVQEFNVSPKYLFTGTGPEFEDADNSQLEKRVSALEKKAGIRKQKKR